MHDSAARHQSPECGQGQLNEMGSVQFSPPFGQPMRLAARGNHLTHGKRQGAWPGAQHAVGRYSRETPQALCHVVGRGPLISTACGPLRPRPQPGSLGHNMLLCKRLMEIILCMSTNRRTHNTGVLHAAKSTHTHTNQPCRAPTSDGSRALCMRKQK